MFPEPKIIKKTVGHIDITPTVLDLLDMKIPEVIQGKSLLPLIENSARWKAENCYFESLAPNLNRNWAPLYGIIRGNHKYVALPIPELYDLDRDFKEQKNLASKEISTVKDLKAELDAFLDQSPQPLSDRKPIDRDTRDRLRSLGYTSGSIDSSRKKTFSTEDDPKNLIELDKTQYDALYNLCIALVK